MKEKFNEIKNRAKNRANFLIAHLASQRNCKTKDINDEEKNDIFIDTFGELVFQECLEAVENNRDACNSIKQYFGVKD